MKVPVCGPKKKDLSMLPCRAVLGKGDRLCLSREQNQGNAKEAGFDSGHAASCPFLGVMCQVTYLYLLFNCSQPPQQAPVQEETQSPR